MSSRNGSEVTPSWYARVLASVDDETLSMKRERDELLVRLTDRDVVGYLLGAIAFFCVSAATFVWLVWSHSVVAFLLSAISGLLAAVCLLTAVIAALVHWIFQRRVRIGAEEAARR